MIYLEISDSAGQKHIDLMGTYSISEVISMISEAVGDEDTDDESSETETDEDSEESSEDSEKERQQMIVEARILHNIALKRYGD